MPIYYRKRVPKINKTKKKNTPSHQKITKLAILPYSLHVHNSVQTFLKPEVQIYYHKYPYQCHVTNVYVVHKKLIPIRLFSV